MTPAEYLTLRESLCLSQSDVAHRFEVTDRSARYWDKKGPPAHVAEEMRQLDAAFDLQAGRAVALAKELSTKRTGLEAVDLYRYRDAYEMVIAHPEFANLPPACHGAMIWRTRKALLAAGFKVEIHFAQATSSGST